MTKILDTTKDPSETIPITFDFTRLLGARTISTKTVTASVWRGTDGNPSATISGSASESGGIVTQKVTGGIDGVDYRYRCSATLSDGDVLVLGAVLAVRIA